MKKILIGCEYSQEVTAAFRRLGVKAFSCDLEPGEKNKEWHIQGNLKELIESDHKSWGGLIAFPPCTHLTFAGIRYFKEKIESGKMEEGYNFFKYLYECPIEKKCLENPLGVISSEWIKGLFPGAKKIPYSQLISWEQFGDERKKRTCLWLRGLPPLIPQYAPQSGRTWITIINCPKAKRGHERSRMSSIIAETMANQWRCYFE